MEQTENKIIEQKIKDFIQRNFHTDAYFASYLMKDGRTLEIDWDNNAIGILRKRAINDLIMFCERNQLRLKQTRMLKGDSVEMLDGTIETVGHISANGFLQFGNGMTYYLCDNGGCSTSGEFSMDTYFEFNFENTGRTAKTLTWLFSQGLSGASRGVYENIVVRVWKQIRKESNYYITKSLQGYAVFYKTKGGFSQQASKWYFKKGWAQKYFDKVKDKQDYCSNFK